ncbi:MAG: DUF420 domain-containing protein [Acidobacteriota bacterium]
MMGLHGWPAVNALLNLLSALLLTVGFVQVRNGRIRRHRAFMLAAFLTSTAFLASYLAYHYSAGSTRFQGQGWIRPVYFAVLISHSILAALVVPLVLVTLSRGLRGRYPAHRRVARWTLPIWLYVSVTGVLVYVMLYHLG